jgi:hypothetical protein
MIELMQSGLIGESRMIQAYQTKVCFDIAATEQMGQKKSVSFTITGFL